MSKKTKKNDKDLENFIAHSYEMFGYWADVRIDGIIKRQQTDSESAEFRVLKAIFGNPDKEQVLDLILKNHILPQDLLVGLEKRVQFEAVAEFEKC